MRILVVEDDFLQGLALMNLLEAGGHTAIGPAMDCASAIHFAAQGRAEVALVDVGLRHGECGASVAAALRQRFGLPAMYITGRVDAARRHRQHALGCVHKPFTRDGMLAAVDVVMSVVTGGAPPALPQELEWYEAADHTASPGSQHADES